MTLFLHRFRAVLLQNSFLVVGGGLCAAVMYCYLGSGFSITRGLLWILSIVLCGYHFYRRRRGKGLYTKNEILFCVALILIFAPVYLFRLYDTPRQIGTDEIATMDFEERIAATPQTDWFGLSDYFRYPNAMFLFRGLAGEYLGGVTLSNMRLQSGLVGLCIVLVSYFFFRIFFDPAFAFSGAVLLGFNHALIALSRMAISINVVLLHELIAFTFLLRGYQKRSPLETFIGGVVAGLAFYHYLPGRIVIGVWGFFLLLHLMFYRSKIPVYQTCVLGGIAVLGFVMAVTPLMMGTLLTPDDPSRYAQHQLLIYPEAQELQRAWVGAASVYEGMYINLLQGLTVFNNTLHDHGYEYFNAGHGFVDPVSGVLIWVGLLFALFKFYTRAEDAFLFFGFFFIYLFFAFFTTKNPNYTRFLIILPFSTAFILESLRPGVVFLRRHFHAVGNIFLVTAVFYIGYSNLLIYDDYLKRVQAEGDAVGDTARYIEARYAVPKYHYYIATDVQNMYYTWGIESQWYTWSSFFTNKEQQTTTLISPFLLGDTAYEKPFTVFFPRHLLDMFGSNLKVRFPQHTLYDIVPDGRLQAFEVLE